MKIEIEVTYDLLSSSVALLATVDIVCELDSWYIGNIDTYSVQVDGDEYITDVERSGVLGFFDDLVELYVDSIADEVEERLSNASEAHRVECEICLAGSYGGNDERTL